MDLERKRFTAIKPGYLVRAMESEGRKIRNRDRIWTIQKNGDQATAELMHQAVSIVGSDRSDIFLHIAGDQKKDSYKTVVRGSASAIESVFSLVDKLRSDLEVENR